jgi:cytosine/adenosine deaminase-related metal-dependent hydrolase/uracil-DNA glycosylase
MCLHGSIVLDDGTVRPRQYVHVIGGRVAAVGPDRPVGVVRPDYTLADDELLFPAFLDLHTHASYNLLPLWHSPVWAWDNRFQWRANADYKRAIGAMNGAIRARFGHGSVFYTACNAFSELMALAGGTTVLQESAHLDQAGDPGQRHVLIRSTGNPADMGLAADEDIASIVDWYAPRPWNSPGQPHQDTSGWTVEPASKGAYDGATYLADFAASCSGTRTRGTIVHVAEGRSGWFQTRLGPDAYSRHEFEAFQHFIGNAYRSDDDARRVREARLVVIHGCGMDLLDRRGGGAARTLQFLRRYGIAVIWSPVSNLLLYQDTTPVLPLLEGGVPLVLGTDWTPSGSKTVWEEAKFAAELLEHRGYRGDASRVCLQAITSVAADALGLPLGRIRAGNMADFVIVRRPAGARRGDALATFRKAGDEHVRAVFVGGVPLYGDAALLTACGQSPLPLPDERGARRSAARELHRDKCFVLPEGCGITAAQLTEALHAADHVVGGDRPRLLAADDEAYRERIDELRQWVRRFDPKTSPTPKPRPPKPSGLAPGEQEWIYNPGGNPAERIDPQTADLLARIAPCRDLRCEVPKRHPYYHAEALGQAGDAYGMRVPCMPVVPVLTQRGGLFVMGDYPTAKFTARSSNNLPVIGDRGESVQRANAALARLLAQADAQPHDAGAAVVETYVEELADVVRQAWARPDLAARAGTRSYGHAAHAGAAPAEAPPRRNQFFVPVGDVFAPMQDADYFDGYKVRNVAAGVFLHRNYLGAVGVGAGQQVWLTNLIKCFLFHPSMAESYAALGWNDVKVEPSYDQLLPVAQVCRQWAEQEVALCRPALVLTVGKPPCTVLHGLAEAEAGVQGRVYNTLLGQHLKRDDKAERRIAARLRLTSHGQPVGIVRAEPWAQFDTFHMLHPQAVMMSQTGVQAALVAAIQAQMRSKADGMTLQGLQQAALAYVARHGAEALVRALPYGQRDQFRVNAELLQTHAVTLANLAELLLSLKQVQGTSAGAVLQAQAAQLAGTYGLARDARTLLHALQERRSAFNERYAALAH